MEIRRNLLVEYFIPDELIGRLHNPCLTVALIHLLAFLAFGNSLDKAS